MIVIAITSARNSNYAVSAQLDLNFVSRETGKVTFHLFDFGAYQAAHVEGLYSLLTYFRGNT